MVKEYEITPKPLSDPKGTESEVDLMKTGAKHYLKQLGFSQAHINTMVNMNSPAAPRGVKRVNKTGSSLYRKCAKTGDFSEYHFTRIFRQEPFETDKKIAEELRQMQYPHSIEDVEGWFHKLGFKRCHPSEQPVLSGLDKEKRVTWAKKHVGWTQEQWDRVIWSGEVRFKVYNEPEVPHVLREEHSSIFESCQVMRSNEHDLASFTVWSCLSSKGYGPIFFIDMYGNQTNYKSHKLESLIPFFDKNNITKTAKYIYQEENSVRTIEQKASWCEEMPDMPALMKDWPALSPDLNPLMSVWNELSYEIEQRLPKINSIEKFKEELEKTWTKMGAAYLKEQYKSMSNRCQKVIDSKGDFIQ